MIEVWRDFWAFVRRPQLLVPAGYSGASLRGVAALFGLHLLVMAGLIGAALLAYGAGLSPDNFTMPKMSAGMLLVLAVIFAPVMEEIAFRSWLSGPGGWLRLWGGIAIVALAIYLWNSNLVEPVSAAMLCALALITLILVAPRIDASRLRSWFARFFPALYWLSALAFGLMHLSNYSEPELSTLLWVVPQSWMGLLLGYARVRWGMWANIAMHALHNLLAISVWLLGQ